MCFSSIVFRVGWFLFALGAASVAHMIMALFRNGIGVPKSQRNIFVMPGLSFGDLAMGRKSTACADRS